MALFGKKAMTVEDILEAINTLSDEDKAKVLEEAIDKKSEAEEPIETEAEIEEAKEEIEDKEDEGEPAAEEPAEEAPVEETHEEEPQSEAERAEETADDERVIALESEVSNLKDLISKIMAQLEDQPFGAQHTLPPVDENNGKWEGPATRAYFGRK